MAAAIARPALAQTGTGHTPGESAGLEHPETGRPVTRSTLPKGTWEVQLALGADQQARRRADGSRGGRWEGTGHLQLNYAITDRWQWIILTPAVAYRGGDAHGFEWIPWAGMTGWQIQSNSLNRTTFHGTAGLGGDFRLWLDRKQSLLCNVGLISGFLLGRGHPFDLDTPAKPAPDYVPQRHPDASPFQSWRALAAVGYTHSVGRWITVAFGVHFHQRLLLHGAIPANTMERQTLIGFGSVQSVGLRHLPLIRAHVSDVVSLDGYASLTYVTAVRLTEQTYLAGATFTW
jgi:hypothetical protein